MSLVCWANTDLKLAMLRIIHITGTKHLLWRSLNMTGSPHCWENGNMARRRWGQTVGRGNRSMRTDCYRRPLPKQDMLTWNITILCHRVDGWRLGRTRVRCSIWWMWRCRNRLPPLVWCTRTKRGMMLSFWQQRIHILTGKLRQCCEDVLLGKKVCFCNLIP